FRQIRLINKVFNVATDEDTRIQETAMRHKARLLQLVPPPPLKRRGRQPKAPTHRSEGRTGTSREGK
ncbi:hypothetical protein BGX38DRAFT_1165625, partial [Terfezia claveryi]